MENVLVIINTPAAAGISPTHIHTYYSYSI